MKPNEKPQKVTVLEDRGIKRPAPQAPNPPPKTDQSPKK